MDGLLGQIKGPEDVKKLSQEQLEVLCEEIRKKIIAVVSKNGGHLAPNLGVIELTVALHRVFSTPSDKIVWDVGHQTYPHKILTGRYESFDTIRPDYQRQQDVDLEKCRDHLHQPDEIHHRARLQPI